MKKRMMLGAVALATVGLISAFATSAYATPSKSSACSNCHKGAVLTVTATQKSNNGTTASYSVSAPGAAYIAVFSGSTKTTQVTGASGTISLPVGKTYTLHAVKGPTTSSGYGSKSISPVAPAPVPVPDPTPVPVPDPTPTPVPTPDPTVTPVPDPTPVPTPDPTVTPTPDPTPVPTATVGTCYLRIHVMARNGHGARGRVTIVNVATGVTTTRSSSRHGYVSFSKLPRGKYTVSVTLSNGHVVTRTITVRHHRTYLQLKDHKTRHASESHGDRD